MNIAANSRWNLLGFGFTLAAHLITIPFVIERIGLGDFGRAGLVVAVWAPLLVGTVLGNSIVRLVSTSPAEALRATTCRALNNALLLCLVICAALPLFVVTIAPWIISMTPHQNRPVGAWRTEFLIAGIGWFSQQYSLILQGASVGHRDYRAVALISCCVALANIASILTFTKFFPSSAGYLLGISAGFMTSMILWSLYTARQFGGSSLRHAYRRAGMSDLTHFGKWQGVTQVVGMLGNQVDRYLLSAIASSSVLGRFNVAFRLQEALYALVMKGSEVLFPYFGAQSLRELSQQLRFFLVASWTAMMFSVLLLMPAIPLAYPILKLWAGPDAAEGGALFLKSLIIGGIIGSGSNVATYYFMGSGQAARLAGLVTLYSLGIVVASPVLLLLFGPTMAGVGIIVASALRVWQSFRMIKRDFGDSLPIGALAQSTLVPMLVALLLAAALEATAIDQIEQWYWILAAFGAIGATLAAICIAIALATRSGRTWPGTMMRVLHLSTHGQEEH